MARKVRYSKRWPYGRRRTLGQLVLGAVEQVEGLARGYHLRRGEHHRRRGNWRRQEHHLRRHERLIRRHYRRHGVL